MVRLLLVLALLGCATLPAVDRRDELLACQLKSDCYIVHIKNDRWEQSTIYFNNFRLTEVQGGQEISFPLKSGMLDGARCTTARVKVIAVGEASSTKECIQPGQHFSLQITNDRIWLTPWVRKT